MAIYRCLLIVFTCIPLFGCTVGWYELREETSAGIDTPWECPQSLEIDVKSGYATNTLGVRNAGPERYAGLSAMFREVANDAFKERGCNMSAEQQPDPNRVLTIKVEELQQLSALPQEFLTGLSFGLIPSWGVRPEEFRIELAQNKRSATFAIDEMRINHITMFPLAWLTFALENERREARKALEKFTSSP